jgi:MFS family permease
MEKIPKFNKVVALVTLSDVFVWGGYYIVFPLMGIYLALKIEADIVKIVGTGMGIYLFSSGLFQVMTGILLDKLKGQVDEALVLFLGSVVMGLPFLFFPYITGAGLFYFLQFVYGFGSSLNLVAGRKLFAKNASHEKEGLEYGIYGMIMNFTAAILTVVSGSIANINGVYFERIILLSGILMITGGIWPLLIAIIKKKEDQI